MKKHYPFHCGSQGGDWLSANCDRCKKSIENKHYDRYCDIEQALIYAYLNYGNVSEDIYKRMGAADNQGRIQWMCPEVDWTEEWKSEYMEINL